MKKNVVKDDGEEYDFERVCFSCTDLIDAKVLYKPFKGIIGKIPLCQACLDKTPDGIKILKAKATKEKRRNAMKKALLNRWISSTDHIDLGIIVKHEKYGECNLIFSKGRIMLRDSVGVLAQEMEEEDDREPFEENEWGEYRLHVVQ